ncbi:MAG: VWA domain-containing protein [Planctomycetes bacterium]|nr:VWA domain-containing protein [Planctomycetota bacterium]
MDSDGIATGDGQIQSGTLTAGSFDDYLNLESYYEFASSISKPNSEQGMPDISLGEVVTIHVVDLAGEPIGNARVVVSVDDVQSQSQPLIDIPTRSDGRTLFLTAMDGADDATDFTLTVYPPDGSEAVVVPRNLDDPTWEIILPSTVSALPTQLDLAFVVDTTGSMSDELEYLKVEMDNIVATVVEEFPHVDQHYALVVYRDEGDEYITRTFDFTSSLDEFRIDLSNQHARGGGDYPEAMHSALDEALGLSWREADTTRVLFLIADAPPHEIYAEQTLDAVVGLRRAGVAIYPIAASGVAEEAEFVMRTAALITLSEYCFITDDSGVGNPHAEPNIACYVVERLDQLMIRMIAGELTGERIYADPKNIIRVVGNPVDGICSDVPRFEQ